MSALPPIADIRPPRWDVRKVPSADMEGRRFFLNKSSPGFRPIFLLLARIGVVFGIGGFGSPQPPRVDSPKRWFWGIFLHRRIHRKRPGSRPNHHGARRQRPCRRREGAAQCGRLASGAPLPLPLGWLNRSMTSRAAEPFRHRSRLAADEGGQWMEDLPKHVLRFPACSPSRCCCRSRSISAPPSFWRRSLRGLAQEWRTMCALRVERTTES